MKAEIICVGDKLLSGELVNVNAAFISSALSEIGIKCSGQAVIDSFVENIKNEIERTLDTSDVVIVSDNTDSADGDSVKEAVCEIFNINPVEDNNDSADYNTTVFANDTENGYSIAIEKGAKMIILINLTPNEFKSVFTEQIVPFLKEKALSVSACATINTFGMSEGAILDAIKEITEQKDTFVSLASNQSSIDINIKAYSKDSHLANEYCNSAVDKIKALLGDAVYGVNSGDLANVAVELLRKKSLKIATAESCTSGMLSSFITSVPHSSEIFEMGISAYSDRIKREALSIPADIINDNGAISWQTAMYLAKNVRLLSDSDIGVGITGNAGPTGDEGKPVGLVYVAVADKNGYLVRELKLSPLYSRQKIRDYSAHIALNMIRLYAEAYPVAPAQFVAYGSSPSFSNDLPAKEDFSHFNSFIPVEEDEIEENVIYSNSIKPLDEQENVAEASVSQYESFEDLVVDEDGNEIETDNSLSLNDEHSENKENRFLSFLDKFIPRKTNDIKDFITKIVFIVSLLAFFVSAIGLGSHFISDKHQQNIIDDIRAVYEDTVLTEADAPKLFDILSKENPDIKAWITIENTAIDHPIYQTEDNEYYLNHNMYKKKSRYGALFFDYRNKLSGDNKSQNLTVYGHSMKNGSMFGTLSKYKSLGFYLDCPTIKITTADGFEDYIVFSVMIMNATAKDDNGYLYNFTRSSFAGEDDFNSWIEEARERSLFNTNIEIGINDSILTLVTCADEKTTFENSRLVIMAKKIDDGFYVSNLSAKLNPNPRYPQAWYDAKGLDGYDASLNQNGNSDYTSSDYTNSNDFAPNETTSSSDLNSSSNSNISGSNTSTLRPSTTTPNNSSSNISTSGTNTTSTSVPGTTTSSTPAPTTSTTTPSTSTPSTSSPTTSTPQESSPSEPDSPSDTTTSDTPSSDETSTPSDSTEEETPEESDTEETA